MIIAHSEASPQPRRDWHPTLLMPAVAYPLPDGSEIFIPYVHGYRHATEPGIVVAFCPHCGKEHMYGLAVDKLGDGTRVAACLRGEIYIYVLGHGGPRPLLALGEHR